MHGTTVPPLHVLICGFVLNSYINILPLYKRNKARVCLDFCEDHINVKERLLELRKRIYISYEDFYVGSVLQCYV
jgi:hypothetical protein